jgi:hypothetical protein
MMLIIIIIIFLHGLGRLTCSGIDALLSFPGASTISSPSRFVVKGVFRKSGVVHSFRTIIITIIIIIICSSSSNSSTSCVVVFFRIITTTNIIMIITTSNLLSYLIGRVKTTHISLLMFAADKISHFRFWKLSDPGSKSWRLYFVWCWF